MFALIGCGAKKKIGVKKTAPIEIESTTEVENFTPFSFDNIIISSKVDLQINQQYLAFDLTCLLYTSPSPRDGLLSRMPSSA